jgi:hypothetical protein
LQWLLNTNAEVAVAAVAETAKVVAADVKVVATNHRIKKLINK